MGWSGTPTSQTYIRDLRASTNYEHAGTTLEAQIGGTLITPPDTPTYNALLASNGLTGTSGYTVSYFEHFDVRLDGTTFEIGETPSFIGAEAEPNIPGKRYWAPARGLIANLEVPPPGDPRIPTNLYQIRSPSVLGMGMTHIPGTITAQSSMQTQRRGPTGVPPAEWGQYDFNDNVSYMAGYAYYECRMRVPFYPGSWCGFWTINAEEYDTPMYPRIELDFVEEYTSPDVPGGTYAHHFTAWLHRPTPAIVAPGFNVRDIFPSEYESIYEDDGTTPVNFTLDFHLIGCLITPTDIIVYYNRKEIHRKPMIDEWKKFYYLILSHQAQHPFYLDAPNTIGWMEVDYVMVWEHPTIKALMPARATPYTPPPFNAPTVGVNVEQIEAGLAQDYGIETILPIGHPGRTIAHSDPSVPPIMPAQLLRTLASNKSAGYSFGTVAVTNSPTRTPLYAAGGPDAANFDVNLTTGEITLKTGVTLENRVYDFPVVCSTIPATPAPLGQHATRVILDMREDEDFDFRYFDRGPFKHVKYWLDASSDLYYDLDELDKLYALYDRSTYGVGAAGFGKSVQADAARRVGFTASAINGRPAFTGGSGTNMKVPSFVGSDIFNLIVTRPNGVIGVSSNTTKDSPNDTIVIDTPTVLFSQVVADGNDGTTDVLTMNVNGVDVTPVTAMNNMKGSFALLTVFQHHSAGGGSPTPNGRLFDATGGFLNSVTSGAGAYFDGHLGLFGFIQLPIGTGLTAEEKAKLIGYGHWAYGLQTNLPIDHPYRSVRPKMWN